MKSATVETGETCSLAAALSCATGLSLCSFDEWVSVASRLMECSTITIANAEKTPVLGLFRARMRAQLRVRALELWPQLASETGTGVNRDNLKGYLSKREERYGATLPLPPR